MEAQADAVPTPAHGQHPVWKPQLFQLHKLVACSHPSMFCIIHHAQHTARISEQQSGENALPCADRCM